jgi:hypothetical protein
VGDDGRLFLEVGVSTDVVTMIVRVNDEPHGLVGDAFQRGLNLFGQRGALVVDEQDVGIAHGGADVSASGFEHVDVAGDFADLDLDFMSVPGGVNRQHVPGSESRMLVSKQKNETNLRLTGRSRTEAATT